MSRIDTAAPVTAAKELFAAVGRYAAVADLTAADWADLAGDCQAAIRVLEATQTVALARVAATDDIVDDRDGTVTEEFLGLGHQRLDAPALVSAQLAQSDAGAGRRVANAVDLLTRLPRLVQVMAAGELDLYRATRIAEELTECPVEVCEEVLDRVGSGHLAGDPVGPLTRRVRRALAAVNSDLVKKRRVRALSDTGLTRSVDADGVDTWIARMPLEQSAQLWDAINERAQSIRAEHAEAARTDQPTEGTGGDTTDSQGGAARPRRMSIHAARLAALTEILMGNITGTFHLHLGVPISLFGDDPGQPVDGGGPDTDPTSDVPTAEPTGDVDPTDDLDPTDTGESSTTESTVGSDRADPTDPATDTTDVAPATEPTEADTCAADDAEAAEPTGDGGSAGHPHPSGDTAPAPDLSDGVRPNRDVAPAAESSDRTPHRSAGACFGLVFPEAPGGAGPANRDPDDLIPVTGFGTAGTVHLRRAFLEHLLRAAKHEGAPPHQWGQTPTRFTVTRDVIGCHDDTGACLTGTTDLHHWLNLDDPTGEPPPAAPRTEGYRPTAALRRLLTARDGRCRFPHCQAAARFADIDHVVPWPAGATDQAGLALLCRRHHRIKQRHRWHVRIRADATLEWITPTGHVRITHPIDHLEPTRPPRPRKNHGEGEGGQSRDGRFGDPLRPPTPPAQLLPELPPRPRPSTGSHPLGDFGWLHDLYAPTQTLRGRARHPVTIAYAELEHCTARRRAAQSAADTERLTARRAAERAARDAEPPPF